MALVAYGNSDSSDYEDDDQPSAPVLKNHNAEQSTAINHSTTNGISNISDEGSSLFNLLPQPSSQKKIVEEVDDEFLHKKETATNVVKPKAKITVPSLNDFKDVEDNKPSKPRAPSGKKSGLLSLLPQPKGTILSSTKSKSMIPHILTQKPKPPLPTPLRNIPVKESSKLPIEYSDDSDNDDELQNDFFSINKPELPITDLPDLPLDINTHLSTERSNQKLPTNVESYFKQNSVENSVEYGDNEAGSSTMESGSYGLEGNSNGGVVISDVPLDEEAIRQLCGSRGKRKREEIQIVDVNQQEVLAEAQEMMRRGLMEDTSNRASASKKKGNEPTNQQKRKHQITYLAHQAKANEAELQNQWSTSRMNKRASQNKYGF